MMKRTFLTAFFFALSAQASTPADIAFERFSYEVAKDSSQFARLATGDFYFAEIIRLGGSLNSVDACKQSLNSGSWDFTFCAPAQVARIGGTGGIE